jgi:HEPN domain-containing protein
MPILLVHGSQLACTPMTDLLEPFKQPGTGFTVPPGEQAKQIARWLRWADADYLAARLLFLINLIIQATTLSTTAIEKYLKAVCCAYQIKTPKGAKGHDVFEIYSTIKASSPTNKLSLNEDYLRLLSKAYRARYPDDLEKGFCLALSTAKMLSQLDRSVLEVHRRFRSNPTDKNSVIGLERGLQKTDPRYVDDNVAIDPSKAAAFFARPSWCLEIRRYSDLMSERVYQVTSVTDDLVFPDCIMDANTEEQDEWKPVFKPLVNPQAK